MLVLAPPMIEGVEVPAAFVMDDSAVLWTPTEHDGLLQTPKTDKTALFQKIGRPARNKSRSAKGSKFMYACVKCPYVNDRLYHAKMHFQRIHVQNGRSITSRRKYEARGSTESPQLDSPSTESVSTLRLLC